MIPPPQEIRDIPQDERAERLSVLEDSLFILDRKRAFIKGIVGVENLTKKDHWYCETFVEVDINKLGEKFEELKNGRDEQSLIGNLCSPLIMPEEIPVGTELEVFFTDQPGKFVFRIDPSRFQLGLDQTTGVSQERLEEYWAVFHHFPLQHFSSGSSETAYSKDLGTVLTEAKQQYFASGYAFFINIATESMIYIQIIAKQMMDNPKDNQPGFALYIPFDESDDEIQLKHLNFQKAPFYNLFSRVSWDGILTYQLDLGQEVEPILELVEQVLSVCENCSLADAEFELVKV